MALLILLDFAKLNIQGLHQARRERFEKLHQYGAIGLILPQVLYHI